jgi:hypothetical protein
MRGSGICCGALDWNRKNRSSVYILRAFETIAREGLQVGHDGGFSPTATVRFSSVSFLIRENRQFETVAWPPKLSQQQRNARVQRATWPRAPKAPGLQRAD